MSKQYSQLTQGQRYQIQTLYAESFSMTYIARIIGVHKSTVSRELKRNTFDRKYCANKAHLHAKKKSRSAEKATKMTSKLMTLLAFSLEHKWSPIVLSERMKAESLPENRVSHTTLYRWIKRDRKRGGGLFRSLLRFRKHKAKPATKIAGIRHIPNRIGIEHRLKEINNRERLGDFEGDTVHGKGCYLVTLVCRKSRLCLIGKVPNLKSETVANKVISLLKRVNTVKSITFDNGSEFAGHEKMAAALKIPIYFADAHASWQRGTNENTNGLIRRFLPKGTPFTDVSHQAFRKIENWINLRPRKVLNGLMPYEAYTGERVALIA